MKDREPCCPSSSPSGLRRREMLRCLSAGIGSVALAGILDALSIRDARAESGRYRGPALPRKAKHVICLFMAGGPSQIDLFDPKPKLARYAGRRPRAVDVRTERSTGGILPSPFRLAQHRQSGIAVRELGPQLASVIDEVCLIRSMYSFNPTHVPARNLFHSG